MKRTRVACGSAGIAPSRRPSYPPPPGCCSSKGGARAKRAYDWRALARGFGRFQAQPSFHLPGREKRPLLSARQLSGEPDGRFAPHSSGGGRAKRRLTHTALPQTGCACPPSASPRSVALTKSTHGPCQSEQARRSTDAAAAAPRRNQVRADVLRASERPCRSPPTHPKPQAWPRWFFDVLRGGWDYGSWDFGGVGLWITHAVVVGRSLTQQPTRRRARRATCEHAARVCLPLRATAPSQISRTYRMRKRASATWTVAGDPPSQKATRVVRVRARTRTQSRTAPCARSNLPHLLSHLVSRCAQASSLWRRARLVRDGTATQTGSSARATPRRRAALT